jgi:hypothetical protein
MNSLVGQTVSHYKIVEKLPTAFLRNGTAPGQVGGGGMGILYRAGDPMLKRAVAPRLTEKCISHPFESLPACVRFMRQAGRGPEHSVVLSSGFLLSQE